MSGSIRSLKTIKGLVVGYDNGNKNPYYDETTKEILGDHGLVHLLGLPDFLEEYEAKSRRLRNDPRKRQALEERLAYEVNACVEELDELVHIYHQLKEADKATKH